MRLRHIEVVHAVLLTGSVSAAARLLHITQPAVSRALQHAELQLGFPLFERDGGRLSPTVEAQTLRPHVERLFGQLDELQRLCASLKTGRVQGELRVLTVLALSYRVLPRAVELFLKRHPHVQLHHQALHSPQIVDALVLHEADVGYVFSAPEHPALNREALGERAVVAVVPKGWLAHAALAHAQLDVSQLSRLPVICLDGADPLGWQLAHFFRENEQPGRVVMTVQTYHVALALAHQGVGVALVDGCTAQSADRSRVDVLPLAPALSVPVLHLRPTGKAASVLGRAFTRCMQQALTELG